MRRHNVARQFGQNGYPAQAALRQQQNHRRRCRNYQPPLAPVANPGDGAGGNDQRADDAGGHQPVTVFDDCRLFQGRDNVSVAEGPVGAAQTGAGDPHHAAQDNQGKSRHHRCQSQPPQPAPAAAAQGASGTVGAGGTLGLIGGTLGITGISGFCRCHEAPDFLPYAW